MSQRAEPARTGAVDRHPGAIAAVERRSPPAEQTVRDGDRRGRRDALNSGRRSELSC